MHYEKLPDGSVKCIKDEIPFDLPESWAWCRIKNICTIGTGATPLKSNSVYYANGTIPWITSAATSEEIITTPADYITERAIAETNCSIYPIGTLIIAMYGEGKTRGQISELGIEACTNQACAALQILADDVRLSQYVKSYFQYSYENLRQKAKGGQQPNLNQTIIAETLIAIPPYQETKRIMDSVYQCIDQINTIEESIESICTSIENAKKRILDLAIHGQLVPQNPADEPATVLLDRIRAEKEELIRQGKIKRDKKESVIFRGDDNSYYEKIGNTTENIDDEIPFEIPGNWHWCRIRDICTMAAGKSKPTEAIHEIPFMGSYPCFGGNGIRGYVDEYSHAGKHSIIGRQGALCGNVNVADGRFYATEHAVVTTLFSEIDFTWNNYMLTALKLNQYATGAAQPGLSVANIMNVFIPLPPYNEQIVLGKRIDQLFGLLKLIEKSLS